MEIENCTERQIVDKINNTMAGTIYPILSPDDNSSVVVLMSVCGGV